MAWMCGLWDPRRNEYDLGQDWVFAARGSKWPPQVAEDDKACVEGLENMLSRLTSQRAVTKHEPLLALRPHVADYKLNLMSAWCSDAVP